MKEISIEPREYQQKIFEKAIDKNTLAVLPTGTGKTLIALMLTVERFKKFPLQKVLILAPTKPLIEQHLIYFEKNLPENWADMQLFTGKTNATKRQEIWQTAEFIFSTPQCIANDLEKNLYDLKDVSLLVVDEAHRCLKNYAYNKVAKAYKNQAINERILALTASPGSDKTKIKEICDNLNIEEVELRTRFSTDVKPYLQELEFEKIEVDFPTEFIEIKTLIEEIYNDKIQELKNRQIIFSTPNKIQLLQLQTRLMSELQNHKNGNKMQAVSLTAQALKISHAIELIETQTVNSFLEYLRDMYKQASEKKSRAVQIITKDPRFTKAYTLATQLNREHPKVEELFKEIKKQMNKDKNSKVIVFAQFRETVRKIQETLNKIEGVKADIFVGQAQKQNSQGQKTGLKQKEQKEMIENFKSGKINVLVATSLHPDEYIVLKNKNKIKIEKIGDFIEFFLEKKDKATQKNIEKEEWQALSSDGKKLEFKPITHIHRHLSKNNLSKIKLSCGFDSYITKDHSLFTFNKNKDFISTKPELNKFIALAIKVKNRETTTQIDVFKEIINNCSKEESKNLFGTLKDLSQSKIRELKSEYTILNSIKNTKLNIRKISEKSEKDYSTVMRVLNILQKNKYIHKKREKKHFQVISNTTKNGKKYLDYLEWFFDNVTYKKGKYRFKINNKLPLDSNFREFLNINYGKIDFPRYLKCNKHLATFLGYYVSEGHVRKTKNTSEVFLAARSKEMQQKMIESIEKGLKLKTRKNWRGIAIDNQISYFLIKNVFKAGIGSYNKEVPEIIFTSPNQIKWAFLKGYIEGDGHIGKNRITITTVSRKLVTGLVLLLRMLGIEKITLHKQKHIFRLNIFESLPFAKIKPQAKNKGHAYYSLIPNALKSEKSFSIYKNNYTTLNTRNKCRSNGTWKDDICYDFIKEIKNIKNTKFVYDFSVKDNENFVGGTGLTCFHNSIAEEGLDIPEVSMVIFYEPVPSAIRKIQRAGRTARLSPGSLKILITKNTRDQIYHYASGAKEKRMYKAIDTIKQEFKDTDKQKKLF